MGPVKRIVSAKELIAANRATRVKVHCVVYDYDRETKQRYVADQNNVPKSRPGLKYQSEVNFINNLECRKNSIIKMVKMLKGNVIVLFNRVEGYGVPLYEIMKEEHENTFIITGDVKGKEREEIRQKLENIDDAVVFATSKIMSTGVSIKNLHHIVLVGSSKAKIGILQTIGRLMRLHESKQVAHMYDIVDRLDLDGKANYTMKHLEERLKFYKAEDHPVEFVTIKLVEQPEHNLFSCS
jgi:superfamily II DNA or RNA helicase